MRLFYALRFRRDTLDALTELQTALQHRGAAGKFTLRDNLHLTLAFLGEIPPRRVPLLHQILREELAGSGELPLTLSRLGVFSGRTLYLGAEPEPELMEMQARLARRLRAEGFFLEDRDYVPHVTLARRHRQGEEPLDFTPISAPAAGAALMLSERAGGVQIYTPLATVQ